MRLDCSQEEWLAVQLLHIGHSKNRISQSLRFQKPWFSAKDGLNRYVNRLWELSHVEIVKDYSEYYYHALDAPCLERRRENARSWYRTHPEKAKEYRSDPEIRKVRNSRSRIWDKLHPTEKRERFRRSHNKRKRGLPTTMILGIALSHTDLHHLSPSTGVYIPESLHKSIYHNIWTGQNMEEINRKALLFYECADFGIT
jgi:hypothetical protein